MHVRAPGNVDAGTLESALQDLEARLSEPSRLQRLAVKALKDLQEAVRTGRLKDLDRLLAAAIEAGRTYHDEVRRLGDAWTFPSEAYVTSDAFLLELERVTRESGVTGTRVLDGRLYSFPHIVRSEPRDLAVRIGKKKHAAIRPTHLARTLRAAQQKPGQANLSPTLHAIERAYLLVTKGELGHAVPLTSIHEALTLLPGSAREYTLDDLVMDIYRLDLDGPATTKAGRRFDLPASTSTRGGKGIRFASREGAEKLYSAIRFLKQ